LCFGCGGTEGLTGRAFVPHPPPPDDSHLCQLADVYAWAAPSFGDGRRDFPALTTSE